MPTRPRARTHPAPNRPTRTITDDHGRPRTCFGESVRPLPRRPLAALLLLAASLLVAPPPAAAAARVTGIRWGVHDDFSRCVIEFSGSPARAALENRISDLRLLYIDLPSTDPYTAKTPQPVDDPAIRSFQTVYLASEKRLRLAVKVERAARPKLMTLENPGRVVVDFYWTEPASATVAGSRPAGSTGSSTGSVESVSSGASGAPGSASRPSSGSSASALGSVSALGAQPLYLQSSESARDSAFSASATGSGSSGASSSPSPGRTSAAASGSVPGGASSAASPASNPASSSAASKNRRPVIVLDPGHGGWHKGAVGTVGGKTVYEKDITLAIANKVKARLESRGLVDVRLTRTRDVYIGLFERTQIAEDLGGDLFVSIHCNSVDGRDARRRARGVEFWYWNKTSSSSAAAQYLEKLENDEGHAPGLADAAPSTRRLIGNLMADQLESMALRSAKVCDRFNRAFRKVDYFREHNRGIKSAKFKVLETYQMPSVLIEVGFLSHTTEARHLNTGGFQDTIARAMADGIEQAASSLRE